MANDALLQFLKVHSTVPNNFIDELFGLYTDETTQTKAVVDLDKVSSWLVVPKFKLMETLRESYKNGVDYTVESRQEQNKHGGNNYKRVLLTPDCFKRLCMRSRTKKAEMVRTYFIAIESLVMRYKDQMMEGMQREIARMQRNQRPNDPADRTGYIYVIRASEARDSVYKIGRTKDLLRRLKEYQTGRDDEVEVVFKFRTDNLKATEGCLKMLLKPKQVRKYREVFEVDLDLVKKLVSGCDEMAGLVKLEHRSPKPGTMTGGFYCVLCE